MGEEVKVKITDIDFDKHRVSLSIRALLEPSEEGEAAPEAEAAPVETPAEAAEAPAEESAE